MSLDILTPKGQQTLAEERDAAMIWLGEYPDHEYIETNKEKPADVDGILVKNKKIIRVVEVKCRQSTEAQFRGEFGSAWLVTADKIHRARAVAKALCVPLIGFLYLVPDRVLLVKTLTDDNGTLIVTHREEVTRTQATVNGGTALRNNMFIEMAGSGRLT